MFLLRLATDVDYTDEEKCFKGIAEELAHYYAKNVDIMDQHYMEERKKDT